MRRRYLVGPTSSPLATYLENRRRDGECRVFGPDGSADVVVAPEDDWAAIRSRFLHGWVADFVLLDLDRGPIPVGIWQSPLPLLGLAGRSTLHWHQGRRIWPRCDLIVTDRAGAATMAADGFDQARAAPWVAFYGPAGTLKFPVKERLRDLDVVFASREPLDRTDREVLPWLARLARLGDRLRIRIATGLADDDYLALLARARIVFVRGSDPSPQRAWEAVAAGCLVFVQSKERASTAGLRAPRECIVYSATDFEPLVEHYLEQEEARRAVARAGLRRLRTQGPAAAWAGLLGVIEREWPGMAQRAGRRATRAGGACPLQLPPCELALALSVWERAEGSAGHDLTPASLEPARRVLKMLDQTARLDLAHWEPESRGPSARLFQVEWDRSAWRHAGNPEAEDQAKRQLVRWRLHESLARATGDLVHHYEALLARPDLPAARAALGIALARAGRSSEAIDHLARAVNDDPFDSAAARALDQLLESSGCSQKRRRLARDRLLLAQAAPELIPSEPWFSGTQPTGDELASIVIPCCNQLAFTQGCLESVFRHTRPPYELLLVDNASDDGTSEYLDELETRSGPTRVHVIHNATNVGFPASCNQALAQARGRYLVLLNNDTLVATGWLEGLIAWSLHDWPKVGLVGAVSNAAAPPQQIAVDYRDPSCALAFAARRLSEFAGRALEVERLTGFCLLIRREVIDRIGGLDERFGLGFFDDDDLCVRAREAGFGLRVALNVFVHHFGSRTFAGLGIDCHRQLEENFARFQVKWGPERSAGYRLAPPLPAAAQEAPPDCAPSREPRAVVKQQPAAANVAPAIGSGPAKQFEVARPLTRPRVSLCLIVKNEHANLPDCLGCATDLVDEVIVVDTGSTDATRSVASRLGARVFEFAWVDDFAAARNESLRHATGDWIFWLDADDRLDEAERRKLRTLFAELKDDNVAFVMKCLCASDPSHGPGSDTVVDHIRLFRNDPRIRWQYRVHEQIMPSVRRTGARIQWVDVTIRHVGYQDPDLRRAKLERDIRLLERSIADEPDEPFVLFNFGSVYVELGRVAEALPLLKRSLANSHPSDSIVRKLYALIVQCHRRLEQAENALESCRAGRALYPDDAELLFQEGLILRAIGDSSGAEARLLQLLQTRDRDHFASVDPGLRGFKARHNLAVLYQDQGRWSEAQAQWQAVTDERPDFTPAWLGLGELYLSLGKWKDLEAVARRLSLAPGANEDAAMLLARSLLKQNEFGAARGALEQAIGRNPRALRPRVILSHVLLQEGRDPKAAETALREILALDPANAEARHNLTILLSKSAGRA